MLGSKFKLSYRADLFSRFNIFSDVICFYDFVFKGEVNKCQGLQIDKDGKPVRNPEVSKGQDMYKYTYIYVRDKILRCLLLTLFIKRT